MSKNDKQYSTMLYNIKRKLFYLYSIYNLFGELVF